MATAARLARRLDAIETVLDSAAGCPECGHGAGEHPGYQIVEQVSGPERCSMCGWRYWIRLEWPREGLQ